MTMGGQTLFGRFANKASQGNVEKQSPMSIFAPSPPLSLCSRTRCGRTGGCWSPGVNVVSGLGPRYMAIMSGCVLWRADRFHTADTHEELHY